MQSIANKTLKRIRGNGRGWVFTPRDFLNLGSRAAVDQALSRLARSGTIRRLRRGLYDYPRVHSRLGQLSPAPDVVARAVARKGGHSLQASGALAANVLGLSTQVPARSVYLTDGPSQEIQVGQQTVYLRRAQRFAGARGASRFIFQALSYVGKDRVNDDVVQRLQSRLSPKDKRALARDSKYALTWMQPVVNRIAQVA